LVILASCLGGCLAQSMQKCVGRSSDACYHNYLIRFGIAMCIMHQVQHKRCLRYCIAAAMDSRNYFPHLCCQMLQELSRAVDEISWHAAGLQDGFVCMSSAGGCTCGWSFCARRCLDRVCCRGIAGFFCMAHGHALGHCIVAGDDLYPRGHMSQVARGSFSGHWLTLQRFELKHLALKCSRC
jgi:hypothetical protein